MCEGKIKLKSGITINNEPFSLISKIDLDEL